MSELEMQRMGSIRVAAKPAASAVGMVLVALVLVCARLTGAGAEPAGPLEPSSVEMTSSGGLLRIPGSVGNPSPFGNFPGGAQVRGIAVTRDGAHAWVVGADGGVFALAARPATGGTTPTPRFFGSLLTLGIVPRGEIVGIAATAEIDGFGSMPTLILCTFVRVLAPQHVIAAATYQTVSRPVCDA